MVLKNADHDKVYKFAFRNDSQYYPIEVYMKGRPLLAESSVHLTAGLMVECRSDVYRVGELTHQSYDDLLEMWDSLNHKAQQIPR